MSKHYKKVNKQSTEEQKERKGSIGFEVASTLTPSFNAIHFTTPLEKGEFDKVGTLLSRYFSDKRLLSRTTLHHPPSVGRLLQHLEPFIEGASLAGAGGGGFLFAILRPDLDRDAVLSTVRKAMRQEDQERNGTLEQQGSAQEIEEDVDVPGGMWSWKASIARTGLVVSVGHEC